jgi:hypothetical protein
MNTAPQTATAPEAGQIRGKEVWETAARNSEIKTALMNSLIKSTQALLF